MTKCLTHTMMALQETSIELPLGQPHNWLSSYRSDSIYRPGRLFTFVTSMKGTCCLLRETTECSKQKIKTVFFQKEQ